MKKALITGTALLTLAGTLIFGTAEAGSRQKHQPNPDEAWTRCIKKCEPKYNRTNEHPWCLCQRQCYLDHKKPTPPVCQ